MNDKDEAEDDGDLPVPDVTDTYEAKEQSTP